MNSNPPLAIHRSPWPLLLALLLAPCSLLLAQSASQQLIPFQGRLTNQQGVAYTSGQYSITFNMYSQAVGGSTLWTERHEKVGVTNGMVNVFLGSIAALTTVDFSTVKYLGITIDADGNPATADPEMVPRQMIIPAFAAKQSERARTMDVLDGNGFPVSGQSYGWAAVFSTGNPNTGVMSGTKIADNSVTNAKLTSNSVQTANIQDGSVTSAKLESTLSTGLNPPGTILAYGGANAPAGYLVCDGAAISRTTYAALFTVIGTAYGAPDGNTFNLPDLRGQFLRGYIPTLQTNCTGSASSNNVTTAVAHPFNRTGMRVVVSGTPATGLSANTTYYIINVNSTTVAFASSAANALAGTKLNISGSAASMVIAQAEDPNANARSIMAAGGNSGNAIGSIQADDLKSHNHDIASLSAAISFGSGLNVGTPDTNQTRSNNSIFSSGGSPGNETRPRNAYVNYIIKY